MPFNGSEGKSWNFFDVATGKWEQHWMSAGAVLSLQGTLEGGAMKYTGVTPRPNGPPTQQRLTFTPLENHAVHQFREQSADGGKTWTVAFDGRYTPHQSKEQPISDAERKELLDHLRLSQNIFAEALKGVWPGTLQAGSGPLVDSRLRRASGPGRAVAARRCHGTD